jgi:hypothetical protein
VQAAAYNFPFRRALLAVGAKFDGAMASPMPRTSTFLLFSTELNESVWRQQLEGCDCAERPLEGKQLAKETPVIGRSHL